MWLEDAKVLTLVEAGAGADLMVDLVTRTFAPDTWSSLVGHIAFDTDVPDPLLVALLGKSAEQDLRGRATLRFMHPHAASIGPESTNLRHRKEAAAQWRLAGAFPPLFVEWLNELINVLDASINRAELREAEERWS